MPKLTLLARFSLTSLALFIVIGLLVGYGITHYLEQQAIDQQKLVVSSLVPPVVGLVISKEILEKGVCDGTQTPKDCANSSKFKNIDGALSYLSGSGLVRVKIWNRQGMIAYSDKPDLIGQRYPVSGDLAESLDGVATSDISPLEKAENANEKAFGELLEVYTPLKLPGENEVSGAFEGYYEIDELRDRINATNGYLWTSIAFGFAFLYVSLFTIVRGASQRILRQSSENAILLADTERKAARLQVLNELARSINSSSFDLDDVFRTALRGIDRIVKHAGASITLLDEHTGTLLNTVYSETSMSGERAALDVGVRGEKELLGGADTFICSDTRVASQRSVLSLAERGVLSLLVVSICLGSRRLGLLQVISDLPDAFDEEDAAILKGLADQLAVAIENTRLIKETAETTALRETNRLKDEFVSMVSHDLRTPLSSIKGYSRTLLASDGNWDATTRQEFLTIIASESDKLADLVENLLEMTRIEAGRLPIMPEPILLWRFCKEVVERVGNHYPQMRFDCQLSEQLPVVEADPRRVEQVLVNLLQNAAKYSGADVVKVSASYAGGHEVVVRVEDNGIGIAPEHLPQLFSKFYRVEKVQADSGAGTGLGLAIAKALVEAQGGRIWVESKPSEGATFFFTLPAFILDDEEGELSGKGSAPSKSVTAAR